MTPTDRPLVVVVDDDAAIARTLAELLDELLRDEFEVLALTTAHAALALLNDCEVAVLLADLRMPAMNGIELLTEARLRQPALVGVLLTAHADMQSAMDAINSARVLAFLTKPWDEKELFLVIRRAVDAHLALRQLLRATGAIERELLSFEHMSQAAPAPLTAERFGGARLRTAVPERFQELAAEYSTILGRALDERIYKVDHHISQSLLALADHLGALNAGPRDVIEIHVTAFKERLGQTKPEAGSDMIDIGRLLVLELMGDVVAYYRSYTLGVRAP